eukprot:TRINITY_DN109453_c0_g1_i1.p1 TRINITY_DN109453_c0_g1~~TRINITY_DN109453_c0_g1_i1.p1  ORF type:complete len:223 (-),score=34.54 TRINITY_DN109453_c0_g1_i1:42-659(-)
MAVAATDGLPVLVIRSACRLWDSPALLAAIWAAAALSSVAVMSQHQRLSEAHHSTGSVAMPVIRSFLKPSSPSVGSDSTANQAQIASDMVFASVLDDLGRDSSLQVRRQGLLALLQIADNLRKHPNEPKYGLLYKMNPTFLSTVGQLPGHEKAMRSLGFVDSTSLKAWRFNAGSQQRTALEGIVAQLGQAVNAAVSEGAPADRVV